MQSAERDAELKAELALLQKEQKVQNTNDAQDNSEEKT